MGQTTYTKFADTPVQKRTCFGRLRVGGGDEANKKSSRTGANCQDKKVLEV